jgi:prepilin-type N-terminal cleavage/methylation domain-containing protein
VNFPKFHLGPAGKEIRAFTLIEMLVAAALGSLIVTLLATLWIFSLRSFTALGNYVDLDAKSRYAVDSMLREIREATRVTAFQTTGSSHWLTLTNAQVPGVTTTYSWDSTSRKLVCQKTGEPGRVYLTECDLWEFEPYQRTPLTNGTYVFYPATNSSGADDASICKLINMTWKCSRTILGQKVNTENVQTAQVVLRNKQ